MAKRIFLSAGVLVTLVVIWALLRVQPGLAEVLGPALALIVVVLLTGSLWAERRKA